MTNNIDFETLSVKLPGSDMYDSKPGICFTVYFAKKIHDIASSIADAIELYMKFAGNDALCWYGAPSGSWLKLTSRKINRDLKLLIDFPLDHKSFEMEYNQNGGVVEDYYFFFYGTDLSNVHFPSTANLLRMDFPHDIVQKAGLDMFLDFVVKTANKLPFQSANIGFGFKSNMATKSYAARRIHQLLPRYYGFDPCDITLRHSMKDHTLMAHWINLIDEGLVERLGGYEAVIKAVPKARTERLQRGILIRGAKLPPIGDINRRAPDIGCLPDVARLLKPTRVELTHYFPFDTVAWLSRFDEMENRDWEQKA